MLVDHVGRAQRPSNKNGVSKAVTMTRRWEQWSTREQGVKAKKEQNIALGLEVAPSLTLSLHLPLCIYYSVRSSMLVCDISWLNV
jgi:hypothetical protein